MTKMTIAAFGLSATLFAGAALAQSPGMTVDQVDSNDPFGEIEVHLTMLDPKTIDAWSSGLDEERQAELRNRCLVMLDNPARYDIAARTFCSTLLDS